MLRTYESYRLKGRKKGRRNLVIFSIKLLLIAFVIYLPVTCFFITPYRINSISMAPTLSVGERVFASPLVFGITLPFSERFRGLREPERGDLIVVLAPEYPIPSSWQRLFSAMAGFFTLQRTGIGRDDEGNKRGGLRMKRIIGVPGDTVFLDGFTAFIKKKESQSFEREKDVITVPYSYDTTLDAKNWSEDFPLSGNLEEIRLHSDEYFVMGDNRPQSRDSRFWGPIDVDRIVAKVLVRYWPLSRISTP
jgi:signal peptidase I